MLVIIKENLFFSFNIYLLWWFGCNVPHKSRIFDPQLVVVWEGLGDVILLEEVI